MGTARRLWAAGRVGVTTVLVMLLGGCAARGEAAFRVGERETVVDFPRRHATELRSWPDGNIGVVREDPGRQSYYAANSTIVAKTSGPLQDPIKVVVRPGIHIRNPKQVYN